MQLQDLFAEAAKAARSTDEDRNFKMQLEKFYSTLDLIEFHLQSGLKCLQLSKFSAHHLPLNVACQSGQPNAVNFNQFLDIVNEQMAYKNEIQSLMKGVTAAISKEGM